MSVDAVQLRLICEAETAVAVKVVGTVGRVVSGGDDVGDDVGDVAGVTSIAPPPPQPERPRSANSATKKTPQRTLDPTDLRFDIR